MKESIVYFKRYFPHLTEKEIALRLESIEQYEKDRRAFIAAFAEKRNYKESTHIKKRRKKG